MAGVTLAKSRLSKFLDRAKTPETLVELLGERQRGIDSDELVRAITSEWGGATALARDIKEEFDAAKPGSVTRQRLLEMFARLVVQTTDREHTKVRRASDMTDEELKRFAAQLMPQTKEGTGGLEAQGREEAGPDHG